MKKNSLILFLLIAVTGSIPCMKRSNPEEEIQEQKEPPKRHRPEDAPKSPTLAKEHLEIAKEIPKQVTLKVPVSGSAQTIEEVVDLVGTMDAVGADSLYNVIKEGMKEKRGFILARVPTYAGDKPHVEYYEFDNLHKSLFNRALFPAIPNAIAAYNRFTPQRAPISGQITYFLFNSDTNNFDYFSNDYELVKVRPEHLIMIVNAFYGEPARRSAIINQIGSKYFNEKNYKVAKYWFEKNLELENPKALYMLGSIYQKGLGIESVDSDKAKQLYEKAAQLGNPSAMNNLAYLYEGEKDYAKAFEWYNRAVVLNNAAAMNNLGDLYEHGKGLDKPDLLKAREWYEKAYALGDKASEKSLIKIYRQLWRNDPREENVAIVEKGAGLKDLEAMRFLVRFYYQKKNHVKFYEYAQQLAQAGDENAMMDLGYAYVDAFGLDKPDYQKAREWLQNASKRGNPKALNELARLDIEGLGIDKPDYKKARELLEQAVAQNFPPAMILLGGIYLQGLGMDKPDFQKAQDLFEKAAKLGDSEAMLRMALINDDGIGLQKPNYQKARDWYELAAAKGNPMALNNLGYLYESGHGLDKPDYKKALEYYSRGAALNDKFSLFYLGEFHEKGLGVAQDYQKAVEWYEKALKAGDKNAEKKINEIRKKIVEQEKK